MVLRIKTTADIGAMGWNITKTFFLVVVVGTMISAASRAITQRTPTGLHTQIPAVIRASRTQVLTAGVAVRALRVAVKVGERVKAGTVLAELESPALAFEVESARRRLELAEMRGNLLSDKGGAEYQREEQRATDALADSIRRRIQEYSLAGQQDALAAAEARRQEVASLVSRQLATASELQAAQQNEANAHRNLSDARQTQSRLQEDLQSALSQQKLVRLRINRTQPLNRSISMLEIEQARKDLAAAEARLAELNLIAPFDGVVLNDLIKEGETVPAGVPLARIADVTRLELEAAVGAAIARELTPGTQIQAHMPTDPPVVVHGTVTETFLSSDSKGGYAVRAAVANPDAHAILVGMEAVIDVNHRTGQ